MNGTHPNRRVIFLDNAVPIPFVHDPNNPDLSYQIGFSLSNAVKEKIAEFEPSIIHVTCPDSTCLHLIQYARTMEIPLMGTYHSNIPEYMEHYPGFTWLKYILAAFFRHQYNFLQALYVPTPYIAKHLTDNYKMDRVTNLAIWGRGIDLEKFSPNHRSLKFRREALGVADDVPVVCWVGRLVPEKRPDIFANVIRKLHALQVPFHALVIGAGPCEEELKALPNTTFTGWMSGHELSVAYASSDIFLFPSAVETFGNVTLEAAASGLPIVVEEGCSGHLVQDGINGYACKADEEDEFFQGTYALIMDAKGRASFAKASRELSLNFEQRAVVRQMLENYSRVTDEFYCEYGGHHVNRDAVYRKEHSFVAGNHPRPSLLVMVEFLFVVLFQVMCHMISVFNYVQESLLPSNMRREATASTATTTPPTSPLRSPTVAVEKSSVEKKKAPCASHDHHQSDKLNQGFIQMVDVELLEEGGLASASDDLTESTVASSSDMSPLSLSSSSAPCICGCTSRSWGFKDFRLSHALAIAFVHLMFIQCRAESALRHGVYSLMVRRSSDEKKRKNSSVSKLPSLSQRARSSASEGSDDDSVVSLMRDESGVDEIGYRQRRALQQQQQQLTLEV